MKKHLFLTALVLALVMCFSCGIFAHDIEGLGGKNQYVVKDGINYDQDGLWIGTLDQWKDANKPVGTTNTVFENGEAINGDDIIMINGEIGIVLAVETRNPWGYPAGSIIDAGYCNEDGSAARDTVWAIEFLAHRWDSWAPENCGVVTFELVEYAFDGENKIPAVKVSRIFDQKASAEDSEVYPEFNVVTYYGLGQIAGEDVVYYFTEMTNTDETHSAHIKNDIAITNKGDDGGFMIGKTAGHICGNYGNEAGKPFSTFLLDPNAVLDGEWESGLAYDKGSLGYKELVREHTYAAGESFMNKHYVVIDEEPSTAAVVAVQNELLGYEDEELIDVTFKAEANDIVVVKDTVAGKDFGWYVCDENGEVSATLPAGEYKALVEAAGYAKGEAVAFDAAGTVELAAGEAKVPVTFNVKDQDGNAIFARVELFVPGSEEGEWVSAYPTVRYTGDAVYLDYVDGVKDVKGSVNAEVEPGEFKAVVYGQGFWFYSNAVEVFGDTTAEDFTDEIDVEVNMVYDAPEGYLSGDLHHHANKNDAFSDPAYVIPSLMASDLDVAFITDHDFTVNNYKGYTLAQLYGMEGFLPSEEISCSWAHFNVIPQTKASYYYFLDQYTDNNIMDQFGDLPDFVEETHNYGATITANHPWYSYGLFTALSNDAIPGGYTDDYDCVEINSCDTPDSIINTVLSTTDLWTAYITGEEDDFLGASYKPHYLVGGSDTHDVRYPGFADANYENTLRSSSDYVSGKVRTYAYVGDVAENDVEANGLAFANAVDAGHSFTTFGPLLTADKLPGEFYMEDDGVFELKIDIESLKNIKDIVVISNLAEDTYLDSNSGVEIPYIKAVSKEGVAAKTATFELKYEMDYDAVGWIAVMVFDENGSFAVTNPYWIANAKMYEVPFTDVTYGEWIEGDYFAYPVEWAYFTGVTKGISDTEFGPKVACTRAQAVTFLYRAAGEPVVTEAEIAFTDVDKDAYYYNAVQWAVAEGITKGTSETTFEPNKVVTRGEMVTFLHRAAGEPAAEATECEFTDVAEGAFYYDAVLWAVENGIAEGVGGNLFAPANTCDRAQTVTFLYRAFAY